MTKISLIVNDAGGGHRASGRALATAIAQYNPNWQTHETDVYHDILNIPATDGYNLMLKLDWTFLFWPLVVPCFLWYKKLRQKNLLSKLKQYWRQQQPDLVVSLIPFVNRELYQSWQQVKPGSPFVILMTDFASDPPHFWLEAWEKEQNISVICPTPVAAKQALDLGYPRSQIFEISGVVLHPNFYEKVNDWKKSQNQFSSILLSDIDRKQERKKLGLDLDLATGVVFFGGQGSNAMFHIAKNLSISDLPIQLIFLCGKNQEIISKLDRLPHHYPWFVKGFTTSIPYYLSLADFFIGKPGPASLSEAIACNLPIITICNSSTLWQERYNVRWVREQKVGIIIQTWKDISEAVEKMIQPQAIQHYQSNTKAITNTAMFDVLDILKSIDQNRLKR